MAQEIQATVAPGTDKPAAKMVSMNGREKWVTLDYPVAFDGIIWEQIRVRRVTGEELNEYLKQAGQDFVLPPVVDCPIEVWNGMDADDQASVDEAAMEFMPKRLRAAAEALAGNTRDAKET